ncbi:helix-turn-helix domain-containing protein [Bacillus infantis]|uniref:helix-turn-helix domain-containing protein n=1 Tax=Bacillus infantis TaxID=324767 RepID=UPI003CF37A29
MSALLSNPERKAELVLNTPALKKYLKEKGWTLLDLSQRMGISYNMLHLVMKGKRNPGNVFIAGVLAVCEGGNFEQFFTVTEERRQIREVQAV